MCILFIALHQHPQYPLIIAANRDEFHQRPTQAMHWWPDNQLLAGKDLAAGGTWMAIAKTGQFAALTNFRKLPIDNSREYQSRGDLVLSAHEVTSNELSAYLTASSNKYQGFNLLWGDIWRNNAWRNKAGLTCFDSVNQTLTHKQSGFFSLCNGAFDDIWPKMAKGEQALEHYVNTHSDIRHEELQALLTDKQTAPDNLLPNTGLPYDWEKQLSAIFIQGEEYGTRSSCIYTLSHAGVAQVSEFTYQASSDISNHATFQWQV
ncbi:NRDE family protein [Thalassotalea euphylliae]|uniref:NRDE family protein n=1 Tax=Thalassotalea euphylliae TaxID=1655234 RepID=A0A3E0TPB6_9GAMM|nr:NRDE family protein [Thalassotalea euphylliae]REL26416.1 NRDE family protein [Thalassotalea euphylliae]